MPENAPDDKVGKELDHEIEALQNRLKSLRSRRSLQVSNILASRSSKSLLARLRAANPPDASIFTSTTTTTPNDLNPLHQALLDRSAAQLAHNQECLYRTCAGITTFRVQDPDPFAVDRGRVLGVRIEAFTNNKFLRPYYVFFNKPWKGSQSLRVHRHTVPPCIPLAALAAKHMPLPKDEAGLLKERKQDLDRFVRVLRREIANYHNRVTAIAGLKRSLGLREKDEVPLDGAERVFSDVSTADAEARQIKLEWVDGRVGRIVINDRGDVQKCVVTGENGRDVATERRITVGANVTDLGERLNTTT